MRQTIGGSIAATRETLGRLFFQRCFYLFVMLLTLIAVAPFIETSGRGALLTNVPVMASAFKTPTLRNVDQRAPYMHNGSEATLDAVVELYDRGGGVRRASLSPEIKPLNLTAAQKQDLVAFLRTLSSQDRPVVVPALPR